MGKNDDLVNYLYPWEVEISFPYKTRIFSVKQFWFPHYIKLAGFFISPDFPFPRIFPSLSRFFFILLLTESMIFIQNSKLFKEMVLIFSVLWKNYRIFMLMSIQRDFNSPFSFVDFVEKKILKSVFITMTHSMQHAPF